MEGTIAVFIPIISVIVTGLVLVTWFYFRSKEKQMMIEKGMSYEQMIELMTNHETVTARRWGSQRSRLLHDTVS